MPATILALTLVGGCGQPKPTILSVSPSTVANTQDTTITITGTHFQKTPKVSIALMGGTPISLAVTYVDSAHVTAIVPMGTPVGAYTLTLTNPDGQSATAMLTVTMPPPITIKTIVSPYGCSTQDTPITIDGDNFESTPQAALVGAGAGGADLPLKNVAFLTATKVTGVVPAGGTIGGPYALKITNPDGATGELMMAFTITKICPPIISDVSPSSVVHNYNTMATGSTPITITGLNFQSDASVVLVDQTNQEVMLPNVHVTTSAIPTTLTVDFNASASNLTDGIYLVRVKDSDAPTSAGGTGVTMTGDYSLFVVTNPSGKFTTATMGKALPSPRRGLGVIGGQLNAASRFLYAVAGDSGGVAPMLLADGLVAPLSLFGNVADVGWLPLRKKATDPTTGDTLNTLASPRTGVGIAEWNNWIYVIGGTTALGAAALGAPFSPSSPTAEVWKARILPANEAPTVTAAAAKTAGKLALGTYYYKVSTLVSAGTPGYGVSAAETVGSDEQVVTLSGTSSAVTLTITSAAALAGHVAGYRVYRTAMANGVSQTEVFLADADATGSYTDDGSATP
ncbi:MAG TPA: IPT/TIG domain-containing protein, partial [Polyangia bacterium]